MNQSEHSEQAEYFKWAKNSRDIRLHFAFAIPNGVKTSMGQAKKLKAEGLKAGVPDVCLPVASGGYHSLWLEFKTRSGRVSDKQAIYRAFLEREGHLVMVPRSHGEAIEITERYLRGEV
jgi:hypothetical protein